MTLNLNIALLEELIYFSYVRLKNVIGCTHMKDIIYKTKGSYYYDKRNTGVRYAQTP